MNAFCWIKSFENWTLTERLFLIAFIILVVGLVVIIFSNIQSKRNPTNFYEEREEIIGLTVWDAKDVLGLNQAPIYGTNRKILPPKEEDKDKQLRAHKTIIIICIVLVVHVIIRVFLLGI